MDACETSAQNLNTAAEIRRKNLAMLVEKHGLAVVSRKVGKPDRQINDMLVGRKAFGEKVARAIEAAYDPDTPPGWLDVPPATVKHEKKAAISAADREILSRYHSAAAETRAAVDLLLLNPVERNSLAPAVWATVIAIEAHSVSALTAAKKIGSKRTAAGMI